MKREAKVVRTRTRDPIKIMAAKSFLFLFVMVKKVIVSYYII